MKFQFAVYNDKMSIVSVRGVARDLCAWVIPGTGPKDPDRIGISGERLTFEELQEFNYMLMQLWQRHQEWQSFLKAQEAERASCLARMNSHAEGEYETVRAAQIAHEVVTEIQS